MSGAERFALAGAALLLLLQASVAFAPEAGAALEFRRAAIAGEPWRVVTAHWVHINWPHALINAAAWVIVARLFARELPPARQLIVLLAGGVAVGVGLEFVYPPVDWYRGFSGVLHALYFTGATLWLRQCVASLASGARPSLWLPIALVAGGWIKVWLEQPAGATLPYAEWLGAATVPQAHLIGAACGTLIALVYARIGSDALARDSREQTEQK